MSKRRCMFSQNLNLNKDFMTLKLFFYVTKENCVNITIKNIKHIGNLSTKGLFEEFGKE